MTPEFGVIHYNGPNKKRDERKRVTRPTYTLKRVKSTVSNNESIESKNQKDVNFNRKVATDIIKNYIYCTVKEGDDISAHHQTIRSVGLLCIYEKEFSVSGSPLEQILNEKTHEIFLENDKTRLERETMNTYGVNEVGLIDFSNSLPTYNQEHNAVLDIPLELQFTKSGKLNSSSYKCEIKHSSIGHGLVIDTNNLKNEMFIEAPTLSGRIMADKSHKSLKYQANFINLPSYISTETIELLFDNFCNQYAQETNKYLFCTNSKDGEASQNFTRRILNIYLSLAFSNITVFKAILLWSAWNVSLEQKSDDSISKPGIILPLQLNSLREDVISDLERRLSYFCATCCDHTIAIVILLLEIGKFNAVIDPEYWLNLTTLMLKIISLRGGVKKLSETPNGLFFAKIFSFHYFSGYGYNLSKNNIDYLNIENIHSVYNIPLNLNSNSYYFFMKKITSVVGEILHLCSLLKMAKNSDTNGHDFLHSYDSLNSCNISRVLDEARDTETRLLLTEVPKNEIKDMLLSCEEMGKIAIFLKESTSLLLYQLVYNIPSVSTLTLLLVKRMIPILQEIFDFYQAKGETTMNIYMILPIFAVGCDIIGQETRSWYMENLKEVYKVTKKEKFFTVILLVEKIWLMNEDGSTFIFWPEVAEENGLILPLCV
ncbi:uncharacterized protein PRCAT00004275001 [Priceomyces carsonii]|uniref:uncharacterized protein n=1 Tax=Priceomyces carsonii TaxID=28549 RepID=UPI002ED8670F|nr:unnamed protein product [Priceomyces carsonii]